MSGESGSVAPPESGCSVGVVPQNKWRWLRLVPLAAGVGTFIAGLWTGLARLGVELPGGLPALAEFHGALMISGFLGAVISLERAVAIGRWWAYAAPALSAMGAVALITGAAPTAAVLFLAAGLSLTFNSVRLLMRQPALFIGILCIAVACWAGGTTVWLMGGAAAEVTGWWLAFLILTIVAERLELSRLLSPPWWSQVTIVAAVGLMLVGVGRHEFGAAAAPFSGIGLLALAAWLVKHDIARRTIRLAGLARFTAACLLAGYFWLGLAGVLLIVSPPATAAFSYDAIVHALTIGFVLSMIFGHAPIILPAVTGWRVQYSRAVYGPLALLHLTVALRIAADLADEVELRTLSGPVTVLALVTYALTLVIASRRAAK